MGEGLEGMAYGVYGMYGVYRVWDTGCGSGVAEYGVWDAGYGMRAVGCGLRFGRCEVRPQRATRMGRPAPAYISHQPSLPDVGVPSSQPRPPQRNYTSRHPRAPEVGVSGGRGFRRRP